MTEVNDIDQLDDNDRAFLLEGLDDYVGLWQFAQQERRHDPAATNDQIRHQALERVGRLLKGGFMMAGTLAPDGGFQAWTLSPGDSLERINREWHSLGHDPNIPDTSWFQNTKKGDSAARQFSPT